MAYIDEYVVFTNVEQTEKTVLTRFCDECECYWVEDYRYSQRKGKWQLVYRHGLRSKAECEKAYNIMIS